MMIPRLFLASLFWGVLALPCFADTTLYSRLGGKLAISRLVDGFLTSLSSDPQLMANPKLREFKTRVDRKRLHKQLTQRVCQATGGPCKKEVIKLNIEPPNIRLNPLDWLSVVGDLQRSLDESKIGQQEKTELVLLLMQAR
ncbi:hypothetical protein WDW86_01730 [Bdellovibrionota bacterium FG-2]